MERRLAVLAGSNAQALNRRRVRRLAWMLALAAVFVAGAADAKPRRRDAKLAFDRGVTAYQKGNFEGASEALGKSFALERDVDTLFAWAQSERKLEHYDKAIELYEKLLTFNLPAANRSAIELNLEECRTTLAQQKPKGEPAPIEPRPAEPLAQDARPQPTSAALPGRADGTPPEPEAPPVTDASIAPRPWYKDPVALGLGGVGIVATGVGVGLLISAKSLDSDSKAAKDDYTRALDLRNQARQRGNIGGATAAVGVAALIGAGVWVVVHRKPGERTVTGWLAPGGGGLALAGGF